MKDIDLNIVRLKYEKEDEAEILSLCKTLIPILKQIKNELLPVKQILIPIPLNFFKTKNLTTKEAKLSWILESILKKLLSPSYHFLIPNLATALLKRQNKWLISKEYLSKEIINPNDDLSLLSAQALNELQLTYLLLKYPENILSFMTNPLKDQKKLSKEAYDFFKSQYKISRNNIKTPEEVVIYVWQNIKYGWKNSNGEIINHVTSNWYETYQIPSVEEVLFNHYGCCVDMARVSSYLLKEIKYQSMVQLTEFYHYFHAYCRYQKDGVWYHLDAEANESEPITKEQDLKTSPNLGFSESINVYDLPENIDGMKIKDVYKSLEKERKLRKHKKLANLD